MGYDLTVATRPGSRVVVAAVIGGLDLLYRRVWCRSAYAAGVLDLVDGTAYTLAPQMGTLLLNSDAPGYLGWIARTFAALREGGVFLVSEFPFPESVEACRGLPAQIMCGIQFFEAHIGCPLLPTSRFVEPLTKAGFSDVAAISVTPVHVVVHGAK